MEIIDGSIMVENITKVDGEGKGRFRIIQIIKLELGVNLIVIADKKEKGAFSCSSMRYCW
jgi:hypothetical protein